MQPTEDKMGLFRVTVSRITFNDDRYPIAFTARSTKGKRSIVMRLAVAESAPRRCKEHKGTVLLCWDANTKSWQVDKFAYCNCWAVLGWFGLGNVRDKYAVKRSPPQMAGDTL